MAIVDIRTSGAQTSVRSPINDLFVTHAKKLGGKWNTARNVWEFDARDEQRVRELCVRYYGSDGLVDDVCTLRVKFETTHYMDQRAYTIHGRPIARAFGRDSGAKQGDGVVFLSGRANSGGSVKNWDTRILAGSEILVRDFPRAVAEKLATNEPGSDPFYSIEPEEVPVDVQALTAERAKLVERIAEIDNILAIEAAAEDYAKNAWSRAMTNGKEMEDRFAAREAQQKGDA